jgi:hypothetical protein
MPARRCNDATERALPLHLDPRHMAALGPPAVRALVGPESLSVRRTPTSRTYPNIALERIVLDATRKLVLVKETVLAEAGQEAAAVVTRVAGLAVLRNPLAGKGHVDDLSPLFDLGEAVGERVMPEVVALLPGTAPTSYGKAAIVGVGGDLEHGAALVHPRLGRLMRAAVGGGEAIIPSNVKVAAAGASIDVPLGNKDDVWAFDFLDTMTVAVADAPRPGEVMLAMAVSDGGRPNPRVGKGRTPRASGTG